MRKFGKCLLLIVVMLSVSGSESSCKWRKALPVNAGVGAEEIPLTENDLKVISDGLVNNLLKHNIWCAQAPECKKE